MCYVVRLVEWLRFIEMRVNTWNLNAEVRIPGSHALIRKY